MPSSSRLRVSGSRTGFYHLSNFEKLTIHRFNLTGLEENVPAELWAKYEPHYYRGLRMLAGLKDHQYTPGT